MDALHDEAQQGELLRLSFLLSGVPHAFVAIDAADPDLSRRMGNLSYVSMAIDTLASTMDASLELLLIHEERAFFAILSFNSKPLRAMTRQAHRARYLLGLLRGRLACRSICGSGLRCCRAGHLAYDKQSEREKRRRHHKARDLKNCLQALERDRSSYLLPV